MEGGASDSGIVDLVVDLGENFVCQNCGFEPCDCEAQEASAAETVSRERRATLKRQEAHIWATPEKMVRYIEGEPPSSDDDELPPTPPAPRKTVRGYTPRMPDLDEYFGDFPNVNVAKRIKICTAYASYLRSVQAPVLKRRKINK